ncbi:kinase-like domain-containing protein [Rhizophagus irregularis DAOM 181602=DAOM 197198]|nr:kinase-like domain-containing protein [Rhizophagus irregularis DAOM 181602=DAOM 197198]
MEKIKLNDEIIEQIKDFEWGNLTIKQSAIIEKLILNEELNRRYKDYGLCRECKQPKAGHYYNNYWCQSCNSKHFQEDFKNWTSGNHEVDKFIQSLQIKSNDCSEVLEWIEYDKLEKVEYLAKGGFGITYKAIWKDGYILDWNLENNQWERSKKSSKTYENYPVVLKCLHNSQDITAEFLREVSNL